ncbi:MAG: membrane protein insertion efficiency factor YidD [Gammaproteobacteria bacterium]
MSERLPVSARIVVGLIRGYQYLLSPWLGSSCRHLPTCSSYAVEAISQFGVARGTWLALKRVGRCHPWAAPTHDPVPSSPYKRAVK